MAPIVRFAVLLPCLLAGVAACREEAPVVPAATARHVMQTATEPAARVVFAAAGEAPANEAGWRDAQANAAVVADSARRLMRAVRGGAKGPWLEQAKAMADAAEGASRAAGARDAQALASAGDALYGTCEGCHRLFLQKRAGDK